MYDHMLTQLEALHQKAKLFVVSSKNGCIKKKLKDFKDRTFILEVIGSDKVKEYKPSPDGILYIVNKYHLNKMKRYISETLYLICKWRIMRGIFMCSYMGKS